MPRPGGAMNRVPTTPWEEIALGRGQSGTAVSRGINEMWSEMQHALDGFKGYVVAGFRFAYYRGEDEAEFSGARLFVRAHGVDQFFRRSIWPRRERG